MGQLVAGVENEYDQIILYKILKELIKYIFEKESVDLGCLQLWSEKLLFAVGS